MGGDGSAHLHDPFLHRRAMHGQQITECSGNPTADTHVSVQELSYEARGKRLFEKMTWQIPRGKFVALVGSSGVGKSTLLYCLAGLNSYSGQISYRCNAGCDHSPAAFRLRLGFVYQDLRLVPNSTLLKNVLCGRLGYQPWWKTMFGFDTADRKKAGELLNSLGIAQYANCCAGEVSGGEQQRAAVARALLQDPEVLLADEPVAHLDEQNARRVLDIFKEQVAGGKTVVCSLHDRELVEEYADTILHLDSKNPANWRLERRKRV
jgi:phosphonate transport system ATP-binding protein